MNKGMIAKPHLKHKLKTGRQRAFALMMIGRAKYFKLKNKGE